MTNTVMSAPPPGTRAAAARRAMSGYASPPSADSGPLGIAPSVYGAPQGRQNAAQAAKSRYLSGSERLGVSARELAGREAPAQPRPASAGPHVRGAVAGGMGQPWRITPELLRMFRSRPPCGHKHNDLREIAAIALFMDSPKFGWMRQSDRRSALDAFYAICRGDCDRLEQIARAHPDWERRHFAHNDDGMAGAPHTFQRPRAAVHHVGTPRRVSVLSGHPGLGAGEADLLDEVKGYLTREGGRRWTEIMAMLNNAMWDWQEVRDGECGVERYGYYAAKNAGGCPNRAMEAAADEAEARYQRIMEVRDLLAEVYRRYDDFGLEGLESDNRGVAGTGGLGEPITAMAVAAIIAAVAALLGGISLIIWATAESEDAGTRREAIVIAKTACDADPNSQACKEALRASKAPPKAGIPWGMIAFAGVAAVAINAFLKGRAG